LPHGFPGEWEPHCSDTVHISCPSSRSLLHHPVTLSGNLSTVLLIRVSPQLHHPMYIFPSHLASTDIGYSSSVTPNMLVSFLVERNTISYLGCFIQLDSAAFFGTLKSYLLAVMAYSTKMSTHVCVQLLIGAYTGGFLTAYSCTFSFFSFLFCGPNRVNHFFCDFTLLVELSSVTSFSAETAVVITVLVIAVSYTYILITILKMHSTEGCQKAFSTCTSHLTAVALFYGTATFIYVMPKSSYSTDQKKVVSVFYTVLIPMLNPLIYSLRNNEIKGALKRQLVKKIFS
uniref:G-protein coupled receptors family 1 profile domain-containing protein n=1 Tax=Nannospalax galili TaxID=1026970 RepID=A0A8C6QJ57_NANGA